MGLRVLARGPSYRGSSNWVIEWVWSGTTRKLCSLSHFDPHFFTLSCLPFDTDIYSWCVRMLDVLAKERKTHVFTQRRLHRPRHASRERARENWWIAELMDTRDCLFTSELWKFDFIYRLLRLPPDVCVCLGGSDESASEYRMQWDWMASLSSEACVVGLGMFLFFSWLCVGVFCLFRGFCFEKHFGKIHCPLILLKGCLGFLLDRLFWLCKIGVGEGLLGIYVFLAAAVTFICGCISESW